MSCAVASTSTSSPSSRAVALVIGPIETTRAPAGTCSGPAERVAEETYRRTRRERHVIGLGDRRDLVVGERFALRVVEGEDIHVRAALLERFRQDVAGLGRARDEHAPTVYV